MTQTVRVDTDRPYRGRRLSWAEFYRERPDLRPDNDNKVPPSNVHQSADSGAVRPIRAQISNSNVEG